jgi:hypothetical protein
MWNKVNEAKEKGKVFYAKISIGEELIYYLRFNGSFMPDADALNLTNRESSGYIGDYHFLNYGNFTYSNARYPKHCLFPTKLEYNFTTNFYLFEIPNMYNPWFAQ